MSAQSLSVHLSRSATRRVFHYGIQLHGGQFYQSAQLQVLRRQFGERLEVTVRYDDDDLTAIHVLHPEENTYFRVPNREPESVRGMSASQYEWVRKYRRQTSDAEGREISIAEAKAELRKFVGELLESKKIRERTQGARLKSPEIDGLEEEISATKEVEMDEASHDAVMPLSVHRASKEHWGAHDAR